MQFVQDFKYTIRLLRKNLMFTAIFIATLGIGIGLSTTVFTIVESVLLKKLDYPDPDRLISVAEQNKNGTGTTISFGTYSDWKERSKSIGNLAVYREWQPTVTDKDRFELVSGVRVSYDFFNALGVQIHQGRNFSVEEEHPGVKLLIVSRPFWRKYLNSDAAVVGRALSLNGKPYTVVGVLPDNFKATGFVTPEGGIPEVWALLGYDRSLPEACRSCRHLRAIARLNPSGSVKQAQSELAGIEANLAAEFPNDYPQRAGAVVKTMQEKMVEKVRPVLYILQGTVILLLIIVCSNISSLLFSRVIQRSQEIGLRVSLGATRARLVRQFLTESFIMAVLGGIAGVIVSIIAVRFAYLLPSALPRANEIAIDGTALGFALLVSLLAGAVFGVTPALLLSRNDSHSAFREDTRSSQGRRKKRLQDIMVVSEIALALILMGCAGLLLRSFIRLTSTDPGFQSKNVVAVDISLSEIKYDSPTKLLNFYHEALDHVKTLPSVDFVGLVSSLPISGGYDRVGVCLPQTSGCGTQDSPRADRYIVSPAYLPTMRIPVLQGRGFTDQDIATSVPVALVGKTLAKQLGADPVGQKIKVGDQDWYIVVGVVGDVRQYGLDVAPKLQIYLSNEQLPQSAMTLVVHSGQDPTSIIPSLRAAIGLVDKEQSVFNIHTMDEYLSLSVSQQRFALMMSLVFGCIGFFLAVLGIYGVTSYSVSRRTQEIGIRMALGAQRTNVLYLILRKVAILVGIGIVIGTVSGAATARVIGRLLFETSSTDPLTYIVVALVLIFTGLLAGYLPARKAMSVNPITALRMDA